MPACERCGSADLVQISLSPGDRAITFWSCRGCEHRWWDDRATRQKVALPAVLDELAS